MKSRNGAFAETEISLSWNTKLTKRVIKINVYSYKNDKANNKYTKT